MNEKRESGEAKSIEHKFADLGSRLDHERIERMRADHDDFSQQQKFDQGTADVLGTLCELLIEHCGVPFEAVEGKLEALMTVWISPNAERAATAERVLLGLRSRRHDAALIIQSKVDPKRPN